MRTVPPVARPSTFCPAHTLRHIRSVVPGCDADHIRDDGSSVGNTMPKPHTPRYSIEIKNAEGVCLFSAKAHWTESERRVALAQIIRLARLPEVNFYAEPALEPPPGKATPWGGPERVPG